MEKDWEADPPPHLDLKILAATSAKLQVRPERICQMEGEQICMNMVFRQEKVRVSWERTGPNEDKPLDWERELSTTLNTLHQGQEGVPGDWEHEWEWIQREGDYPRLDKESLLGAVEYDDDANNETSKDEEPKPSGDQTRRSGRSWVPMHRTLESQGQHWDFRRMRTSLSATPWPLPPDRQPVDAEPEIEEPPQEDGLEVQAPPTEVSLEDLVLDPAVDGQGRRLDTEREGLGEPDPLVLARSPAVVLPAIQECIPGPRERAQAQDRDPVITQVKDWGAMPGRLELDFGEASLKAYVKILPVLKLNPLPAEPGLDDLDILVKTDIQGTIQSE